MYNKGTLFIVILLPSLVMENLVENYVPAEELSVNVSEVSPLTFREKAKEEESQFTQLFQSIATEKWNALIEKGSVQIRM